MVIRTEHLNLIRKIAWSFYYKSGVNWADLFGEAALAYCRALEQYEPSRGKFTTFAWHVMNHRLLSFVRQEERRNNFSSIDDCEDCEMFDIPVSDIPYFEIESSFTDDAKQIARVVLHTPHLYLSMSRAFRDKVLREKFKEQYGWADYRTNKAIASLRKSLKTLPKFV